MVICNNLSARLSSESLSFNSTDNDMPKDAEEMVEYSAVLADFGGATPKGRAAYLKQLLADLTILSMRNRQGVRCHKEREVKFTEVGYELVISLWRTPWTGER